MKVTFLGGGSLRLLPILRGIMGEIPDVFRGGEIRLLDRRQERAEAVARLIEACPEYQNVSCKKEIKRKISCISHHWSNVMKAIPF